MTFSTYSPELPRNPEGEDIWHVEFVRYWLPIVPGYWLIDFDAPRSSFRSPVPNDKNEIRFIVKVGYGKVWTEDERPFEDVRGDITIIDGYHTPSALDKGWVQVHPDTTCEPSQLIARDCFAEYLGASWTPKVAERARARIGQSAIPIS